MKISSSSPIAVCALFVAAALACLRGSATAQEHVGQYSQIEVETGFGLYNANCFPCHGENGDSIPGVNLRSGQFRRASNDQQLNRLIQTGVPGTAMPPGRFNSGELASLVAYIRSMRDFDTAPATGNAARGRALFEGKGACSSCHRVDGKGSRSAPDLSDIGAIRNPNVLARTLTDPTSSLRPANRTVRAVTRSGTTYMGRRLNEDTYTVQLITQDEQMISLVKAELREYTVLKTSSMPSFKDKLSGPEMDDVVAYLRTLKGTR
jgi:cytochrome c oxidase cbb3-type subunit 3